MFNLFCWAGLEIAKLLGGTLFFIVEPAAIIASEPTLSGAISDELDPMNTRSPITVLFLFFHS